MFSKKMIFLLEFERKKTVGKKSVVFVAELSYMEKLEVALKSFVHIKGRWKIYVLNENLPTEWFTLMNRSSRGY